MNRHYFKTRIFIVWLFLITLLFSCNKTDDVPAPATCNDCNLTVSLNGSEFKSKATAGVSNSIFKIEAKDFKNTNNTLIIQFIYDSLKKTAYKFSEISDLSYNGDKYVYGSYTNSEYKLFDTDTSSKSSDKVTITSIDNTNKVISGSFNFTAKETSTNKVTFTNGTFTDVKW